MTARGFRRGPVYYTRKAVRRAGWRSVPRSARAVDAESRRMTREIILTMQTGSGKMVTLKVGE